MAVSEALTRRSTKSLILDVPDFSSGARSSHSVSDISLDRFSDPGMPRTASAAELAGEGVGETATAIPVSAARRCSSPVTEYGSYRLKALEPRDPQEWSRVSVQVSPRLVPQRHSDDRWDRTGGIRMTCHPNDRQVGQDMKLDSLAPAAWTLKALKAPAMVRCRDVQCCARESGPHPCHKIQRASVDCLVSLTKPKAHTLPRTSDAINDAFNLVAAPSTGGASFRSQNAGLGFASGPNMRDGDFAVASSAHAGKDSLQSHGMQAAAAPSNAAKSSDGGDAPVEDRNGMGRQGRQGEGSGEAGCRGEEEDVEDTPLLSSRQQPRRAKSILVKSLRGLRGEEQRERRNKRVRWRDGHGELLVLVREFSAR